MFPWIENATFSSSVNAALYSAFIDNCTLSARVKIFAPFPTSIPFSLNHVFLTDDPSESLENVGIVIVKFNGLDHGFVQVDAVGRSHICKHKVMVLSLFHLLAYAVLSFIPGPVPGSHFSVL